MKNSNVIILIALAGVGWYLYTRSRGLSLTGAYENPMFGPGAPDRQSLVTPNLSTSAAATNVFSALTKAIQTIVGSLGAQPGNAPHTRSASSALPAGHAGPLAGNMGVPSTGAITPWADPSLNNDLPFWSWSDWAPDWQSMLFAAQPPQVAPSEELSAYVYAHPMLPADWTPNLG